MLRVVCCGGWVLLLCAVSRGDDLSQPIRDDNWQIAIRPTQAVEAEPRPESAIRVIPAVFQDVPEAAPAPESVPAMTYQQAYQAIPFSRTEYEANPGYRHQAAMELMFRQLRPTTIIQQLTPNTLRYSPYPGTTSTGGHRRVDVYNHSLGLPTYPYAPFGYPYGLHGNW